MAINKENITKEYNENRQNFEAIAGQINETLKRVARSYYNDTKFHVYIPPLRIKTLVSVLGKLERKNREADSLFHRDGTTMRLITNDFIGGRILCNTQDDIFAIEKIISTYPRLTVEKRDIINKENGYSALHLDIRYDTYWDDISVSIPLELQIKTHLQHAWAEITHDDDYKPADDSEIDESIKSYYTHISQVLKGLDGFLMTIRKQKLQLITPPSHLSAADTIINSKTLSYTINKWKRGDQITFQEMNIIVKRLKDEMFETIEDVEKILDDVSIEENIKKAKESLLIEENVLPFEMLKYGALLARGKTLEFDEEIKRDLGFVKEVCSECKHNLTKEELEYINNNTDSDKDYYCEGHRDKYFPNNCPRCNRKTSKSLCINCAAEQAAEVI